MSGENTTKPNPVHVFVKDLCVLVGALMIIYSMLILIDPPVNHVIGLWQWVQIPVPVALEDPQTNHNFAEFGLSLLVLGLGVKTGDWTSFIAGLLPKSS